MMAALLSQFSSSGFFKAPICKGLLGCVFITSTAVHLPFLNFLNKELICQFEDFFSGSYLWRVFSCRIAFLSTKDLLLGSLLIYYFRLFERRFGSQSYASYLLSISVCSIFLEIMTFGTIYYLKLDLYRDRHFPIGLYFLLYPQFIYYFLDVPRVTHTHILGIPVTGKTVTYLIGLHLCYTTPTNVISALCGLVAGLCYRFNFLYMQNRVKVPSCLSKLISSTLGKLLRSEDPSDGNYPLGATLEIQRQQQIEMLEQQMLLNHSQSQGPHNPSPSFGFSRSPFASAQQQNEVNRELSERQSGIEPMSATMRVSESHINVLTEMGFSREASTSALQTANNDIHLATNILLQHYQ